jgi:hypothetical protein
MPTDLLYIEYIKVGTSHPTPRIFNYSNNVLVYMARDVMILMRANPLQGPLEGEGPQNREFFEP